MRSVSSSTLLSNAAALLVSLARDSDSDSLWLWSDIVDLVIGFVGWLVGWLVDWLVGCLVVCLCVCCVICLLVCGWEIICINWTSCVL